MGVKKPRLADVSASRSASTSFASAARVANALGESLSARDLSRASAEHLESVECPYGKLTQTLTFDCSDGSTIDWECVNPFCLLYWMCTVSVGFAGMMQHFLTGKISRIGLWCDGVTTGNVLRPDSRTERFLIYFTFLDLPSWFRARDIGWFPVGYWRNDDAKRVKGKISGVLKRVLRVFFKGEFSFSRGMFLPCGTSRGDFFIQAQLGAFIQDEKSHKEVQNIKGAGGTSCCGRCKNIVKTNDIMAVAGDEYLRHYKLAVPLEFDEHTNETVWEMVDALSEHHKAMRAC